jgi:predicted MFS family arabinose efflux permease
VLNVMAAVIVANRVAPEARGRAYAIMNAVAQSASMIGFLVAGPLVAHFSPRLLVMCAGAAGVVAASACLPMVRRESSLSRPTSEVPVEPDTVTA